MPLCHGDFVKAATALNNAGVHLLVRCMNVEACLTFKEATKLMKNLAGYLDGAVTEEVLVLQLQRAREVVARFPVHSPYHPQVAPSVVVRPISSEYTPMCFHSAIAAATIATPVKFPITIDLSASELQEDEVIDVDFYSSVILYNHGVAYDCLAATATTTVAKILFQQKATRIFYLTSNLLDLQLRDEHGNPKTRIADGRILQLLSFVTYTLMQVCVLYNLPVEYHSYCAKLEETLLTIDVLEQLLSSNEHCAAVA